MNDEQQQDLYDTPHPLDELFDMLILQMKKHIELIDITRKEIGDSKRNEELLRRLINDNHSIHRLFNHVMANTGSIELAAELQSTFTRPMDYHLLQTKSDKISPDTAIIIQAVFPNIKF